LTGWILACLQLCHLTAHPAQVPVQVNHKPVTMAPHRADETALVALQLGLVVDAFDAYDQKSDWDLVMVTQSALLG